MVDLAPISVASDRETFLLRYGYVRADDGDLRSWPWKPYASITLSNSDLSLLRPASPAPIAWPLASIVSTTMARERLGGEGDPSRWLYTMTIEFRSGETLIVGIQQGTGDSEDASDPNPGEYRRFIESLHRCVATHAPQAKMVYRGGPLLQGALVLLLVLGVAALAVDRLGTLLVTNLVFKVPTEIVPAEIWLVLMFVAFFTPAGMVFWAWQRVLRRGRRYKPTDIPTFLLPEIRAR